MKIPQNFVTVNGYDNDVSGTRLGNWINMQRVNKNLSDEKRNLLLEIGMRFISLKEEKVWYSLYEQALKFYKQYGAWSEEKLDRINNKQYKLEIKKGSYDITRTRGSCLCHHR